MKIKRCISKSEEETRSTLLVARSHYDDFLLPQILGGLDLTEYLHRLLRDPLLEYKLKFLKAKKWKKTYQKKGQDLVRLHLTPDEGDWARISMASNGTGFSRCYIFVYLMLLDRGLLTIPSRGTPRKVVRDLDPFEFFCSIFLDEKRWIDRKLTRVLQT